MSVSKSLTNERAVRLIQITDSHLGPDSNEKLLGMNTDQSLADVLQLIADEQPALDALVCTGDIASAAHTACYTRFLDRVRSYFTVPLGWLPGNHDSAELMANFQHPHLPESRVMILGAWQVVLLDSSVPGQIYGELADSELSFFDQVLSASPDRPTIVALHHQPVEVGSEWIDQYILRNAEAFFAVIERYSQVKAVTWGHVHQSFHRERNGVQLFATPATSVQFKPNSEGFAVDGTMPGYRWFELNPDGTLQSGISRVTGKTYDIDYQSAGY
jgi:3',5'-cyclic-AMP phosphodiesterase